MAVKASGKAGGKRVEAPEIDARPPFLLRSAGGRPAAEQADSGQSRARGGGSEEEEEEG
jgi:hypothetical protein